MLPDVSLATLKGVVTPLHVLAVGCTVFRVWHRYHKRQLWWDDYWAALALLFDLAYAWTPFLRFDTDDLGLHLSKSAEIGSFWLSAMMSPLVTWSARISIGMSIARIMPPQTRTRYLLYAMNGMFGLMCVGQMLQKIVKCTRDTSWHNNDDVRCHLGNAAGVLSLCTDLTADTCLVAVPLRTLWRVRLPKPQRRLILLTFASSVLSSLIGIIYCVFVVLKINEEPQKNRRRMALINGIKIAVILLVCNLLVIAMSLYRVFWKDETDTVDEPSETRSKPSQPLPPTTTFVLTQITPMQSTEVETRFTGPFISIHSAPSRRPASTAI